MDNLFKGIPQGIIISAILILGIAGIVYLNPQASSCDPQVDDFKKQFQGELFDQVIKNKLLPARYKAYLEQCRQGNSSGACYEYFALMKRAVAYVHRSPEACFPAFQGIPVLANGIKYSVELMALLAWGDGPVSDLPSDRLGWMREYEISVFCELKKGITRVMGEEFFEGLQAKVIGKLPSKQKGLETELTFEQKYHRSLFALNCNYF